MSRQSHVAAITARFAAAMGLSDAAVDESGRLSLLIDEMTVTLAYRAEPVEALTLTADLGALAPGAPPPRMLLERSLSAFLANLMTISLAEDGTSLRATTAIPAVALSLPVLQDLATRFIETALETREALGPAMPETPSPPSTYDAPPPHSGMIRG